MEEDFGLFMAGMMIGIVLTLMVGGFFVFVVNDPQIEIKQLGQSICEEEYGMDFESYSDKVLSCKPIKESYDGIKVNIPKAIPIKYTQLSKQ